MHFDAFTGAAIGHPIVRDTVYGYNGSAAPYGGLPMDQLPDDSASIELQRAIHEISISSSLTTSTMITNTTSATKMCVHAKVIRFKHPITGVDLEFTSPPSF
jgi:23S rRNA-/tRNA-specific pseudouridylate synthase